MPVLALAEAAPRPWSGELDIGVSVSTGNTQSTDLAAKLRGEYVLDRWTHHLQLDAVRKTESGETSEESTLAQWQTNYALDRRHYLFGATRWERDQFSGYQYQTSLSGGYGYRLWMSEQGQLAFEIGPGVRRSQLDNAQHHTEFVGRLRGDFTMQLSSNAEFNQEVKVIAGDKNTETEAVSALTVGITDAVALRLSFNLDHNSTVPIGTRKTNTSTTGSIVYRF